MSDKVSSVKASSTSSQSLVPDANVTVENTVVDLEVGKKAYVNPVEIGGELQTNSQMTHSFGNAAVDIELLEKEIAAKEQERREQNIIDLSGEIAGSSSKQRRSTVEPYPDGDFYTLDEPVWDTVKRDLRIIGAKVRQVMAPKNNHHLLHDWDLWGPLFICVFISLMLQGGKNGKGPHFTEVFTLTFFGSCVVTLNTKLLGGNISFFQSLCVLGYCLLPPGLAALICKFIEISAEQTTFLFCLRLLVSSAGFIWAIYASMAFLSGSQPPKRKLLTIYPIFLFYFVISWMIISHSSF